MAPFREHVADTVWVLSKLLKYKVPRRENIKLSIVEDKVEVHPLQKSTQFGEKVRKFAFKDARSWLLEHWYVREVFLHPAEAKPHFPVSHAI